MKSGRAAEAMRARLFRLRVFWRCGLVRPVAPATGLAMIRALRRWGNGPAAGYVSNAARFPDEIAIIDELGSLTFKQVNRRTNALANALTKAGLRPGENVALMARNHRGFIEATVALSKIGANTVLLNTAFSGPQLTDVVEREDARAVIFDEEFSALMAEAGRKRLRYIAWHDGDTTDPTLDQLIQSGVEVEPEPPAAAGRIVILTSGTTGTPKGASRSQPATLDPAVSILSRIPLEAREQSLIAAPLFHSWGFAHFSLGLLLASTYVLQRRFEPEQALAGVEKYRVTSMPMVPVMVQRLMELPGEVRRRYDTSSLRAVPVSGSALPGDLAVKFMDAFGEILYNLYGSTEVAWATIATPQDLRAAPGTAGIPPFATVVKLFDESDHEVRRGERGRIFVANGMLFEGYTGGGTKPEIAGLMNTGDVGWFDAGGRLFVEGRSDDMIVSGGENVFPQEVEDLISNMPGVVEVAIIGVPDEEFGQRLKAFVVREAGASLSENEIKDEVKRNLARFKVPREVVFVDSLPRNATGKVLKRELAAQSP